MTIHKFDIFLAYLNPQRGAEPGKVRPVVIIQNDAINKKNHNTTIICPMTTQCTSESQFLRVHIISSFDQKNAGVDTHSDIMIDHIRSIDTNRLIRRLGRLPETQQKKLMRNISILLLQ